MPEVVIAAIAATAIIVILLIAERGRRFREQEAAGPTFGELLNRNDVLIFDTETTGLGKGAELVEIAIVDTTGALRFSNVVMPVGRINGEASDIHGLTRRVLRDMKAEPWSTYHDEVISLLQEATAVVGWNVDFDIRILKQTAEKHDLSPPILDHVFDMLAFYRHVRKRRWNKLNDAMRDEGLKWSGQSHRAEADCRAVLAVMNSLAAE